MDDDTENRAVPPAGRRRQLPRALLASLSNLRRLRPALIAVLCLAGTAWLLKVVHPFGAVDTWLTWKLALLWFWEALFMAACLGLGSAINRWALRDAPEIPALERLVLSLAAGATAFGLLMYLGGALHVLRPAFAVALPAISIAVGLGRSPRRRLSAAVDRVRQARWQPDVVDLVVIGFGALSVGLIYLQILSPYAPNHDAHWSHVTIARDFARTGQIVQFRAEWAKNYPHFASLFYTWAELVPGLDEAYRMPLVMHTEFVFLLGTLVALVPAVRWLTHATEAESGASWAAFFLFPSIFVYDSNLGASADHVAAFFVLPMFLALVRGTERFSPRLCALGGALAGAGLITKYQTAYAIVPLAVLAAVRLGVTALRRLRGRDDPGAWRRARLGALAGVGGWLAAAGPYFIENTVAHHNPVYPFMQGLLRWSRPTYPDVPYLVSNVMTPASLQGAGGLGARLLQGIGTVFDFSFHPHYSFLGDRPYYGFLFTILAPLSLLLPRGHRLRVGALVAGTALLCWAMNYLVDRNLQIILPLLVAVTAGVITSVWKLGWVARLGLVPLCLAQVFWGGDLMFQGALQGAIDQIRSGLAGHVNHRETQDRFALARLLPPHAKVIMHNEHVTLGLDREVLSDETGSQGLIDYHVLRTPREVYDRFRALGITHVVWIEDSPPQPPLQRDIVFTALVKPLPFTARARYKMAELPPTPPPATSPYRVLALGQAPNPDGIYQIDVLSRCEMRPADGCRPPVPATPMSGPAVTPEVIRDQVDAVVMAPGYQLPPAAAAALTEKLQPGRAGGPYQLFVKR